MQSTYDLLCSLSVYCFFFIQCFDFRISKSVLLDFRCIGTLRDARACFSTSLLRNFLFASAFLSYKYAHLVFTSSSTTPRASDSVTCLSKIKSRLFKQLKNERHFERLNKRSSCQRVYIGIKTVQFVTQYTGRQNHNCVRIQQLACHY